MGGLSRAAREAVELTYEIGGAGIGRWRALRRSVTDDAAALLGADDSERGRLLMGTPLGATRDVDGDSVAGKRHMARELRRKRAGRDQSVRASGRPWTGGDTASRIGCFHDEAELFRPARCRNGVRLSERSEQESAVERRP